MKCCEYFRHRLRAGTNLVAGAIFVILSAPGIGLAAPQVGVLKRVIVVDAARDVLGTAHPRIVLGGLYLLTTVITAFLSNPLDVTEFFRLISRLRSRHAETEAAPGR